MTQTWRVYPKLKAQIDAIVAKQEREAEMAGHARSRGEWVTRLVARGGWVVLLKEGYGDLVARCQTEAQACQIVREHNLHGRLVEACSLAHGLLLGLGADANTIGLKTLDDLIAEAEKED